MLKSTDYASPRQWPALFIYLYFVLLFLQGVGCGLIITGSEKIGGRYFLSVFAVLAPNVLVAVFTGTLFYDTGEVRHPAMNKHIAKFLFSALCCHTMTAATSFVHIVEHGDEKSFEPKEQFGDSGTSYFFAIFALLNSFFVMGNATLRLQQAYCANIYKPAEITFDNTFIQKCQ